MKECGDKNGNKNQTLTCYVRTTQMRQQKGRLKSYWQDQELPCILIQLSEELNPFPSARPRNTLDLQRRNL